MSRMMSGARRLSGTPSYLMNLTGWTIRVSLAAVLLALPGGRAGAQAASSNDDGPVAANPDFSRSHPIGNDTVLRMVKAGLDDSIVIQTIETRPGHFDTEPDDLIALKQAGVSPGVIAAMQARSAGLAIRKPQNDAGNANTPSARMTVGPAAVAAGVDEIGVYYKDRDGQWTPLKTERVQFKSGAWAKSTFTNNIVKQDLIGRGVRFPALPAQVARARVPCENRRRFPLRNRLGPRRGGISPPQDGSADVYLYRAQGH